MTLVRPYFQYKIIIIIIIIIIIMIIMVFISKVILYHIHACDIYKFLKI